MGATQSQRKNLTKEEQKMVDFIDETVLAHDVVVFGKML